MINKTPTLKSQDKKTNCSILKSNSHRQPMLWSQNQIGRTGIGIFKRASLQKPTNEDDQQQVLIQESRSSVTRNKDLVNPNVSCLVCSTVCVKELITKRAYLFLDQKKISRQADKKSSVSRRETPCQRKSIFKPPQ